MATRNYALIGSVDELAQFVTRLIDAGTPFGFDIETGYLGEDAEKFALHPETAIVVGFSFSNSLDWARYVPLHHDTGPNLDNAACARLLWELLATGRGVAHNASFEMRHLSRWFVQQLGDDPALGAAVHAAAGYFPIRSDTQVEAYLVADYESFGLKSLVKAMFGHTMTELFDLFPGLAKNRRKMLRFNVLELTAEVVEYACEDALWCLAIHQAYYPKVVDTLLYRTEMEVLTSVCEMEDVGLRYDWAFMRRGAEQLRAFRDLFNAEIQAELSTLTGATVAVNLASPAKVAQVLYEQLGMRTTVFTATTKDLPLSERKMSTGKIALAGLAKKHPVVKKILQWKEQTRLLGTYLEKYEKVYGFADDGNVHPNHLSAVVVTGRFAVASPPYQGSPRVYHFDLEPAKAAHLAHAEAHGQGCDCEEMGPEPGTCFRFKFRDAIVAPPEHYMLGFDFSQAELRAIAGEAQEPALLRAFAAGQDVHTLTAALMLSVPVSEVTKAQRDVGKTMSFALVYGMQAKALGERLGLDQDEAQALYDKYFAVLPAIRVWAERQVNFGRRHGYVLSRFGRKLPIWEYKSDKRWIQQKGDRACVNYPVQGSATGDAVKIAMVRARRALHKAGLADKVHLVMNVHDALEWYVDRSVPPAQVIAVLNPAVIFDIPGWPPMRADWHVARSWGSPVEVALGVDNSLSVKGAGQSTAEAAPSVEEDEDTGEEVEVLPEVDLDTLRAAARAGLPEPQESAPDEDEPAQVGDDSEHDGGRHVIVTVTAMPDQISFQRFLDLLARTPGPNTLTLRTPEGDLAMQLTAGSALTPADTASVSMVLGAATVCFDAADVDAHELMSGVVL